MEYKTLKEILDAMRQVITNYDIKVELKNADAAINSGDNALNLLNKYKKY